MAEYSKEKLYFLKLPKGFFQGHQMRVLEGLPNGKEYELLYLKLMVESVSYRGYLRFSEEIPYTEEMIASITNTNIDIVRVALNVLGKLGLVERTEGDSLFLPAVPSMTSSTTEGAIRKQEQIARRGEGGKKVEILPPDIRYIDNRVINDRTKSAHTRNRFVSLLIKKGYIENDDDGRYDRWITEVADRVDIHDLERAFNYFLLHYDGTDGYGHEIVHPFEYLVTAINDGLNQIKVERLGKEIYGD